MKFNFGLLCLSFVVFSAEGRPRPQPRPQSKFAPPAELKIEVKTRSRQGCYGAQNGDKVILHIDISAKDFVTGQ